MFPRPAPPAADQTARPATEYAPVDRTPADRVYCRSHVGRRSGEAAMSIGEIVVLAIGAGLFGGAVGAVLVTVVMTRRDRAAQARYRLMDAHVRWLAARKCLTRASGSVVAAFRSLAVEPCDSPYFSLRSDEAQRARSQWCDAMGDLHLAEAELIAYSPNGTEAEYAGRFPCIGANALRAAIEGDEADVDQLMRNLRAIDQRAAEYVRAVTAGVLPPQQRLWRLVARSAGHLESMVEQWSLGTGTRGRPRARGQGDEGRRPRSWNRSP